MGEGLPNPKVVSNMENYHKRIDEVAAGGGTKAPVVEEETPVLVRKPPMSVAEAAAKSAKYAKDREDFEATTKGLPKPGLLSRLKKFVSPD